MEATRSIESRSDIAEGENVVLFQREVPNPSKKVTGLPCVLTEEGAWKEYCLGSEGANHEDCSYESPRMSTISTLDSVGRVRMLSLCLLTLPCMHTDSLISGCDSLCFSATTAAG